MATNYKIPPAMAGNGRGWGGEKPMKKTPKKVHRTTAKSAAKKLGY